jgi:hypothetical protein
LQSSDIRASSFKVRQNIFTADLAFQKLSIDIPIGPGQSWDLVLGKRTKLLQWHWRYKLNAILEAVTLKGCRLHLHRMAVSQRMVWYKGEPQLRRQCYQPTTDGQRAQEMKDVGDNQHTELCGIGQVKKIISSTGVWAQGFTLARHTSSPYGKVLPPPPPFPSPPHKSQQALYYWPTALALGFPTDSHFLQIFEAFLWHHWRSPQHSVDISSRFNRPPLRTLWTLGW